MIYEGRGDVDGHSYISLLFVAVCLHAVIRDIPFLFGRLNLFFFPRISFRGYNSVLRRSMSKATLVWDSSVFDESARSIDLGCARGVTEPIQSAHLFICTVVASSISTHQKREYTTL